jgi:hypothetical protein
MPQTLPLSGPAARSNRRSMRLVDGGGDGSASPHPLTSLEADVRALRDRVFDLADTARDVAPYELTQLHVSLQIVSNELGLVERTLLDARA